MKPNILVEFIKLALLEELTMRAQNKNDLVQAINWLRLNGKISSAGSITKKGNTHQVTVKTKTGKKETGRFVRDRFGTFVNVGKVDEEKEHE